MFFIVATRKRSQWVEWLQDWVVPLLINSRAVPDPAAENHSEDHLKNLEKEREFFNEWASADNLLFTLDIISSRVVSGQSALWQRPEVTAARCPQKTQEEKKRRKLTSRLAAAEEIRRWKLQNRSSAAELDGFFTQGQRKKQRSPSGVDEGVLREWERRSWEPVLVGSEHLYSLKKMMTFVAKGPQDYVDDVKYTGRKQTKHFFQHRVKINVEWKINANVKCISSL